MAKESGIGMSVTVDDSGGTGRDISNDVTQIAIRTPRESIVITGLDKSAMERYLGLADAEVVLTGKFNDAANQAHAVFKTVPSTSVARTVALAHSGQTLSMEMLFENYDLDNPANRDLSWTATGRLSDGTVPTWS